MRFMIIRKADAETEAGVLPSTELIDAMTAFHERLAKAGVLVDGAGLLPSARGAKVRFRAGKPTVLDGPFAEAKELIAGFTMIEVPSRQAAIEWIRQWPVEDGGGNVEIEIRQVATAADFGEAMTPELVERDEALRAAEAARRER